MTDEPAEDRVKALLLERAAACLDHVRAVKYGEASANYMIEDSGVKLLIHIRVSYHAPLPQAAAVID